MPLHDRQMKRIASRQSSLSEHDVLRSFEVLELDREDLIDDSQERIESRLNCVSPIDGDVSMENFLKCLGVRDQALFLGKTPSQDFLGITLVRMSRPDQVHRDIRIDEDHREDGSR